MQSSTWLTSDWVLAAAALTASMSNLVLKSDEMLAAMAMVHLSMSIFCFEGG